MKGVNTTTNTMKSNSTKIKATNTTTNTNKTPQPIKYKAVLKLTGNLSALNNQEIAIKLIKEGTKFPKKLPNRQQKEKQK